MRKNLLTAALGLVVLASGATRADARWWSANGASCAVGDPAIQANRYTIGAGSVKHRPGASGLITLYCAVNPGIAGLDRVNVGNAPDIDWVTLPGCANGYSFRQTHADADAMGTNASVRSQLLRMVKANGDLYSIANAALDSNLASATTATSVFSHFDHAFDFQNYYYYVRVDVDRPLGSTQNAILYGVAIECR